ncbi:hypothetical protein VHEMI07267 [[Torrubiella] hemipterigena]|uniref:Uncharacterized protein n=1 Tax=[Torrubiella] hemipterigena TaxID=1531966 RepID=A0A0A1TL21_9HYPO|nr:hypothetical protein VHEMI07267 [[Torrubiella] hemipterigena]
MMACLDGLRKTHLPSLSKHEYSRQAHWSESKGNHYRSGGISSDLTVSYDNSRQQTLLFSHDIPGCLAMLPQGPANRRLHKQPLLSGYSPRKEGSVTKINNTNMSHFRIASPSAWLLQCRLRLIRPRKLLLFFGTVQD